MSLHQTMHEVERLLKVRGMTTDIEIILALYENGASNSMSLSAHTRSSFSCFNQTLKRLAGLKVIDMKTDAVDRRVKIYDLNSEVRETLDGILGGPANNCRPGN